MSESKTDAQRNPLKPKRRAKHAVVMVLGDVGRSPRMQYHALSLLEEGHYVTLIGYAGEGLIQPLESALASAKVHASVRKPSYHGRLHLLSMSPYQPPKTNALQRLLYYPLRLLSLLHCVICTLWIRLNHVPHTKIPVDVVLVQNPPSVPTLLLAYLYCVWQGVRGRHRPRFVIDWHNLGYTMFEPPDPKEPPGARSIARGAVRRLAERYEGGMAPLADAHLTVTRAMGDWLGENFGVRGERVRVMRDGPPSMFRPTGAGERHELFGRLFPGDGSAGETAFTRSVRGADGTASFRLRDDRPALIVSPTSWTPDEDFSMLLEALRVLHEKIETGDDGVVFPKVVVIVTGKGPQKSHYLPLLDEFNETHPHITIHTLWLEARDYPTLLGCATLGVSLHTSTSGLDLPMKVLDMFGCHVPVCAVGFDCLGELVEDGANGRVFADAGELADQVFELLAGYPGDEALDRLEGYRRNIRGVRRWKENWEGCARHLIVGDW